MYRKTITLTPDKPNFPLDPVWIGQGSAALFVFAGVPDGMTLKVAITPVGESTAEVYSQDTDGNVYVPGWGFPDAGQTQYEVILYQSVDGEDEDRAYWAGKGLLNVWAASTSGEIPAAPAIIPPESYARNPITGLYHLIIAELNELGQITLNVSPTGVDHV